MTKNPRARLVIAAYRPKPGKEEELMALALEHTPYLRSIGLASDRPHVVSKTEDGTIVEVFEWLPGGVEKAHVHEGVLAMWERYSHVCDYVPLNTVAESGHLFAMFEAIE